MASQRPDHMTATGPVPGIVRIGTRASKLALAQTRMMQARIAAALGAPDRPDEVAPLVEITTTGDRIQDRRLLEIGGKALFTKEIEEALLDGRIDCAIHSMKDMPAELPPGLVIAATPEREDARDAFLSHQAASLADLAPGSRIGTASLRRQAQILHVRPDLRIVMMRGNVDSRLAKLAAGEADAILLAKSGLNRLGLGDLPQSLMDPLDMPPAPAQGALAIETRVETLGQAWITALQDAPTQLRVTAERGALTALEGSCRTAIGAYSTLSATRLEMIVEALTPDGARRFRCSDILELPSQNGLDEVRAFGLELGRQVRAAAGVEILFHE